MSKRNKRVGVPLKRLLLTLATYAELGSALSNISKTRYLGTSKASNTMSILGGASISIDGVGFAEMPSDNLINFKIEDSDFDGFS